MEHEDAFATGTLDPLTLHALLPAKVSVRKLRFPGAENRDSYRRSNPTKHRAPKNRGQRESCVSTFCNAANQLSG